MNHFATTVLSLALSASVSAQAIPGKRKPARAVRPEVQACRDRITELVSLSDHFDALTPEKLTSVQKEVNDCVYAESAGLSKDDISAAYKLRDGTGREVIRRIREAAEKTIADDNTLREQLAKSLWAFWKKTRDTRTSSNATTRSWVLIMECFGSTGPRSSRTVSSWTGCGRAFRRQTTTAKLMLCRT